VRGAVSELADPSAVGWVGLGAYLRARLSDYSSSYRLGLRHISEVHRHQLAAVVIAIL
jgi:hypothetical protein